MTRFVVFAVECEEKAQDAVVHLIKEYFSKFPQAKIIAITSGRAHRAIYFLCEQLIEQKFMPRTSFFQMFSADILGFTELLKKKEGK
jgi:hypothetical protein